jgi:hypothetical protein
MTPNGYHVRPATRAELDRMVDWAAAEGWNPGLADADPFWAAAAVDLESGAAHGRPGRLNGKRRLRITLRAA